MIQKELVGVRAIVMAIAGFLAAGALFWLFGCTRVTVDVNTEPPQTAASAVAAYGMALDLHCQAGDLPPDDCARQRRLLADLETRQTKAAADALVKDAERQTHPQARSRLVRLARVVLRLLV